MSINVNRLSKRDERSRVVNSERADSFEKKDENIVEIWQKALVIRCVMPL